MFILGIDIGTQSLKAVVLGEGLTAAGQRCRDAYQPQFPQPRWAEQDPRLWLEALRPAIGRALLEAGHRRRGGRGARHRRPARRLRCGRPQGRALGPCLIWMDRRAERGDRGRDRRDRHGRGRRGAGCEPYGGQDPLAEAPSLARARDIACFHQPVSYRGRAADRPRGAGSRPRLDHHALQPLGAATSIPSCCERSRSSADELPEIDRQRGRWPAGCTAGAPR